MAGENRKPIDTSSHSQKQSLLQKEEEINKIITKSSPTFILSSARQSLKSLRMKKSPLNMPRIPPARKKSGIKLDSPCNHISPDNLENPAPITRAKSDNIASLIRGNNLFHEEATKAETLQRLPVEPQDIIHNKNERPEHKSLPITPSKTSNRTFIIKHKKGESSEKRKVPLNISPPREHSKETMVMDLIVTKSPTEEALDTKAYNHYVPESIIEEKNSDISSLTSNKTAPKDGTMSSKNEDNNLQTIRCDDTSEERKEERKEDGSSGQGQENTYQRKKPKREMTNAIVKKDNQISFDVRLGEILGEGAYGRVYKALNLETGTFLALKEIDMEDLELKPPLDVGGLCQEIEVYQKLDHEHIVRYLGAKQEGNYTYIYMEFMPGGSISSMLKQYGSFEEKVIRKFTRQVALGLNYLHNKRVIHRDIKGANILSDGAGNVKLADFGAAKHTDYVPFFASVSNSEVCSSIKGSLFWMAPELLNQKKHGRKIDIWSLGCTVIEMATACHPWPAVKTYTDLVIAMMMQKCPPIPDHISDCAKDFIRQCCQFESKQRPKIQDLLGHPFIKEDD